MTGISIGPQTERIAEVDEKYDFVELAIGEGETSIEELDAESIKQDLESNNLDLVVHLPFRQPVYTGVAEFDEALIDYFDRLLEFSSELEAEKAVVHVDCRYTVDRMEAVPEIVNQMTLIHELGKKHGVEICFENVNIGSIHGIDIHQLGHICREEEFSMCLDTGHGFAEAGQEELDMFIAEFDDVISHLHIQDTREGEDLHLPIGVGDIDFEEFYDFLEDFEGTKCMEIFCRDPDYLEVSRERIDLS